jgi:hypothetical protein
MFDSPSPRPTLAPLSQHPRGAKRKRGGLRVSLRLPLHAVANKTRPRPPLRVFFAPRVSTLLLYETPYMPRYMPSHSPPVAREVIRRQRSETSFTARPWFFVYFPCLSYGTFEMSICLVVEIPTIAVTCHANQTRPRNNRQCDKREFLRYPS